MIINLDIDEKDIYDENKRGNYTIVKETEYLRFWRHNPVYWVYMTVRMTYDWNQTYILRIDTIKAQNEKRNKNKK